MTAAAMAAYAYDQIDQFRTELNGVSKKTSYESLESQSQFPIEVRCDILWRWARLRGS